MRVAGGLGKAMVKAATSGTGGNDYQPVICCATLLIGVKPLVQEVSQKPAGLRDTDCQPELCREDAGLVVFGVAYHVADSREPETDNRRIFSTIDEFVNLACLKSTIENDVRRVRNPAPILYPTESPAVAGKLLDAAPRDRPAQ